MWGIFEWIVFSIIMIISLIIGLIIQIRSNESHSQQTRFEDRKRLLQMRMKAKLVDVGRCLLYHVVKNVNRHQANVLPRRRETTRKEHAPIQESQDYQENQE